MKKQKKKLERTRARVWHFLMNNIDNQNWAELKRVHNRLTDDLEKLKAMHDENEYAFQDMRKNRELAIKLLRQIKKSRKGKKFNLLKTDKRTWKEIEVKP
jgi:predicted GIY-YIG superfamily endonuclease